MTYLYHDYYVLLNTISSWGKRATMNIIKNFLIKTRLKTKSSFEGETTRCFVQQGGRVTIDDNVVMCYVILFGWMGDYYYVSTIYTMYYNNIRRAPAVVCAFFLQEGR